MYNKLFYDEPRPTVRGRKKSSKSPNRQQRNQVPQDWGIGNRRPPKVMAVSGKVTTEQSNAPWKTAETTRYTRTLFKQRLRFGRQPRIARPTIIDFYLPGDVVTRRKSRRCSQPDDSPARDEWVLWVGSAAVAGTATIGPPRPGTEYAFFVRLFGRITYLRAALSPPCRPPLPRAAHCSVRAHTNDRRSRSFHT